MTEIAAPWTDALGSAQRLSGWIFGLLPFGPGDRTHWTGLVAFLLIGTSLWAINRKSLREEGFSGLVNYLVPSHIYFSRSSLVDAKVFLANHLFDPLRLILSRGLRLLIVVNVAHFVSSGVHGNSADGTLSFPMLLLAALLAALASDFAYYVNHRFHHENRILWPFHKLHHSAEHLTLLTAKRNHPVFDFLLTFFNAICIGPVIGVIYGLFGMYDVATLFGLSVVFIAFNFAGGALRHSHIWLDFGPVLDHIFISPAQHQIHHSMAPRHHDKNYGLVFAVWDWMFGTLYVPKGRETLQFGVADRAGRPEPQTHTSLVTAYAVPFVEAAQAARSPARPVAGVLTE